MFFHICYFNYLSHKEREMGIILLLMILSVFVDDCSMEAITSSVGKTKLYKIFITIERIHHFFELNYN